MVVIASSALWVGTVVLAWMLLRRIHGYGGGHDPDYDRRAHLRMMRWVVGLLVAGLVLWLPSAATGQVFGGWMAVLALIVAGAGSRETLRPTARRGNPVPVSMFPTRLLVTFTVLGFATLVIAGFTLAEIDGTDGATETGWRWWYRRR